MLLFACRKIEVDTKAAFKSRFVTNSLDGSEDYLVSDRLFRLVGEDMKLFREELMKSQMPATLQEVVRNLIPPKGIPRKNTESAELLNFIEEEVSIDNDDVESNTATDEMDAEADSDVSDADEIEEPAVNRVDIPFEPQQQIIYITASLTNIYVDDSMNKDARFLDGFTIVINEHETSDLFLPHLKKLQCAYKETSSSVRSASSTKRETENIIIYGLYTLVCLFCWIDLFCLFSYFYCK